MRSFGCVCLMVIVGLGCIAGDARAEDDEGAREIQRAIEEIEAEIARIEATLKEMQRVTLHRQLADVARRRAALEKKAGSRRIEYSTGELDPFGRRVEARKKAEMRRLAVAKKASAAKKSATKHRGASLEARVARLEAENKKLHALVNALLHRGAHAITAPARPALRASPARPPMVRAPIAARDVVTAKKKSKGGIDARLERIERLLLRLLQGERASAGVPRAPVPPAPPMRVVAPRPPAVRIGDKVFEVKEASPLATVTYGVKQDASDGTALSYTKKAVAKDKAAIDGVNPQIKMLEQLLKQAEERMRELERSLGK